MGNDGMRWRPWSSGMKSRGWMEYMKSPQTNETDVMVDRS